MLAGCAVETALPFRQLGYCPSETIEVFYAKPRRIELLDGTVRPFHFAAGEAALAIGAAGFEGIPNHTFVNAVTDDVFKSHDRPAVQWGGVVYPANTEGIIPGTDIPMAVSNLRYLSSSRHCRRG
jgi:hypothetical protein